MNIELSPENQVFLEGFAKDVGLTPQQAIDHILDCYIAAKNLGPIIPQPGEDVDLWDPFGEALASVIP
jgi:hypothetical protein